MLAGKEPGMYERVSAALPLVLTTDRPANEYRSRSWSYGEIENPTRPPACDASPSSRKPQKKYLMGNTRRRTLACSGWRCCFAFNGECGNTLG